MSTERAQAQAQALTAYRALAVAVARHSDNEGRRKHPANTLHQGVCTTCGLRAALRVVAEAETKLQQAIAGEVAGS